MGQGLALAAPPDSEASTPEEQDTSASETGADAPEAEPEPEPEHTRESPVIVLAKAKWIKHRIIPGESLRQIADRYQVSKDQLIKWNKLNKKNPAIYAGRSLKIKTRYVPPPKLQLHYTIKKGDTWNRVAKAHKVDSKLLRERWNPKVKSFKAGQVIVIWVDPLEDPRWLPKRKTPKAEGAVAEGEASTAPGAPPIAVPNLPIVPIPSGSISVGKPSNGKLVNSVQLPENKALYTIRKPDEAYGSSYTLVHLQNAIAMWRHTSGFTGALKIGAISKKGGGKLKPHSSHRTGRDVDIRLPLKSKGGSADKVSDVDWDATWALVMAFVDTQAVRVIYLTTDRQKHLMAAAKRAGADKATRERMLQYPDKKGTRRGLVRHSDGHTAHIHVRFKCADNETRCENN